MKLDLQNILNLVVVFGILSALTAGIDIKQFKKRIIKPKGILIGLLCQFGILPVTSFLIAYTFELEKAQGVALVILGSCPGGNISNIFCFLWNADLSLSIAMTTASSVLSFAFLTANTALYIPILTKGDDVADIDYVSLAFSVAMVILGICVGFIAAYWELLVMKKMLGVFGFICTIYMIWTALFNNSTGSQPVFLLPYKSWLAPVALCSIAWIISLGISLIFRLPKNSVLAVCLESANQNSVLSAAIIYLSLDEYDEEDIDFAIGIPIMYTIICSVYDLFWGLVACQIQWVNCDLNTDDDTVTMSTMLHRYRQYKQRKKTEKLLSEGNEYYGGTNTELEYAQCREEDIEESENKKTDTNSTINKSLIDVSIK